uniref:DNA-directed DNA polymerase n=1 Tax=Inonotus obliquus TaxID=167356 RepID=A0A5A4UC68_9AGAM|nr:hypothetical protein [Inonotus obliquus]BBN21306.1 hypothetical protein [Inonotus obliquus]
MYVIAKLLLNSLYGRFGMSPKMLTHIILSSEDLSAFVQKIGLVNLADQIELGNKILISYWQDFANLPKTNIAIASAITANARVHMSMLKNSSYFKLFYTDTDSGFLDQPLPDHLVDDKKLGLFKLVEVLTDFVALGPKVYGGKTVKGMEYTKVKGLKTPVSLDQLKDLLIENNELKIDQIKWFNNATEGTISVRDLTYGLKPTNTKRNLIFKNKVLVDTSNKIISE